MRVTLQVALVAAVLAAAAAAPGAPGRLTRAKQPRATRGFKNTEMMTARGFGKRNYRAPRPESARSARSPLPRVFRNSELSVARGFGKRTPLVARAAAAGDQVMGLDNLWEALESSPERAQQEPAEDKAADAVPVDWFVEEMLSSPEFARTVVRKFLDLDQDGSLSPDELLRNTF